MIELFFQVGASVSQDQSSCESGQGGTSTADVLCGAGNVVLG